MVHTHGMRANLPVRAVFPWRTRRPCPFTTVHSDLLLDYSSPLLACLSGSTGPRWAAWITRGDRCSDKACACPAAEGVSGGSDGASGRASSGTRKRGRPGCRPPATSALSGGDGAATPGAARRAASGHGGAVSCRERHRPVAGDDGARAPVRARGGVCRGRRRTERAAPRHAHELGLDGLEGAVRLHRCIEQVVPVLAAGMDVFVVTSV